MKTRVLLAGVAGGFAMFIWMFIAHMVLPLGEAGMREIPSESSVLAALQNSIGPASGIYMFPGTGLPPNATSDQRNAAMAAYQQKIVAAPSGLLIYHGPGMSFSFPKLLVVEFATELLESLIAAWLLSLTALAGFIPRAAFVAGIGLIAAIATNISYWNWYSFPGDYTAAYVFTQAMGFVCAGLAIATVIRVKAPAAITARA